MEIIFSRSFYCYCVRVYPYACTHYYYYYFYVFVLRCTRHRSDAKVLIVVNMPRSIKCSETNFRQPHRCVSLRIFVWFNAKCLYRNNENGSAGRRRALVVAMMSSHETRNKVILSSAFFVRRLATQFYRTSRRGANGNMNKRTKQKNECLVVCC